MVAEIFSYVGYKEEGEVSDIMQRCSHLTRAYFINADLLDGFFVVEPDYIPEKAAFTIIMNRNKYKVEKNGDFSVDVFLEVFDEFEAKMIELQAKNKAEF